MDGDAYLRRLVQFIRANESSLASSLENPTRWIESEERRISVLTGLYQWMNEGKMGLRSCTLSMTPHYLFYVLSRFGEMELTTGPMNIRLERLQNGGEGGNYVSFLKDYPNGWKKEDTSDTRSIRSVSSIRSVVKGVSNIWGRLSSGWKISPKERVYEQIRTDIMYLYSSFTKLPSLRLVPSSSYRMIDGYEEFPFDTAIPLFVFKNLKSLEIVNIEIGRFYGWDRIADNLRFLTVKGCGIRDASELIIDIVLKNIEKRRKMRIRKSNSLPLALQNKSIGCSQVHPLIETADVLSIESSSVDPKKAFVSHVRKFSSPLHDNSEVQYHPHDSDSSNKSCNFSDSTPVAQPHSEILPLKKWFFLKYLSLSNNSLNMLSFSAVIPIARSLVSLDISHNMFIEIPYSLSMLTSLKSLNISYNRIESLQSLMCHPLLSIATIDIRSNRLRSLHGIEKLINLQRLDIRDNCLSDPMEVARLANAYTFKQIWVSGNPFAHKHFSTYRITIFNIFRSMPNHVYDILIDGQGPGIMERRRLIEKVRKRKQPLPESEKISHNSSDIDPQKIIFSEHEILEFSTIERNSKVGKGIVGFDEFPKDDQILIGKTIVKNNNSSIDNFSQAQSNDVDMNFQEDKDYNHQVEALRKNVGENWLTVLNEEMCVKQQ
ncbi:hypothetical protein T552_01735 [Pneumocystis carinii B80]|uniref:Uncharacterized protein n=1 Tax=Pneumocystis carinii (strain B80) TaxID=1408658 RepID=A0A0W4ZJC4_PNEC8|nr:hypothetical protein T552_01735 [Pneumocystis carinii B80]KTW28475.1 hypothetical protein T552_01735 [Pneumocystis carinii B80]